MIKRESPWIYDDPNSSYLKGINSFVKKVEFARTPSDEELEEMRVRLGQDPKCPGNVSLSCRRIKDNLYAFRTVLDSSD